MPSFNPLLRTYSAPFAPRSVSMKTDSPAALERVRSWNRTFTTTLAAPCLARTARMSVSEPLASAGSEVL